MEIWLPTSATPRYRCTVATEDGPCNHPFYEGEERAFERHVARCASENREHIEAQRLASKLPEVFDRGPDRSDVELIEWVKRNREAIIEGRKRVS